MTHTHDIKIDTPKINEVGEMSFTNGEGLGYSMTSLDATIEQRTCLDVVLKALDKFKQCNGGLTEFCVKIK